MLSFKIALSFSIPLTKTLSLPFLFKNPRKTLNPFSISIKSMASSWTCSKCTFINTDSLKPNCQICSSSQSPPPFSSSSNQEKWSCKACTFLNVYKVSSCEICGTRNSSFSSNLGLDDEEMEVGSSAVGNVFLPLLQRCNNAKRKIRDDPVEIADNSVDLSVSRGLIFADKREGDTDEFKLIVFFNPTLPSIDSILYVPLYASICEEPPYPFTNGIHFEHHSPLEDLIDGHGNLASHKNLEKILNREPGTCLLLELVFK